MHSDSRNKDAWERALWLAFLLLLLFRIAPSVFWNDDAEFISAAFCLGIPHPTGFPLYMLLAKGAQLLPIGSVPFRTHLLSLGLSLTALALGLSLLKRLGLKLPAPLIALAALGFLASRTLFLHAAAAEVYSLNLALALAGLWLAVTLWESHPGSPGGAGSDGRRYALLAALTGLSLGGHVALVAMLGLLLTLVTLKLLIQRRLRVGAFVLAVSGGLVGAAVLTYLPIRAASEPFRNWGDPQTLATFLDHISGGRIVRSFAQVGEVSATPLLVHLRLLGAILWTDLGVLLPLGLLGVVTLFAWRPGRSLALLLTLIVGVDLAFSIAINPMGIADLQTSSVTELGILLAAVAPVALLVAWLERLPFARVALLIASPALPLLASTEALERSNFGDDYHALVMGQQVMEEGKRASLLITTSDNLSALGLYLQGVEAMHLDKAHLVAVHVVESSHLRTLMASHDPSFFSERWRGLPGQMDRHPELREEQRVQIQAFSDLLDQNAGKRQIFWEAGLSDYERSLFERPPRGFPLGEIDGLRRDITDELKAFVTEADAGLSYQTKAVLSRVLSQSAAQEVKDGDIALAQALLEAAVAFDASNHKGLANLGAVYSRQGRIKEAADVTRRALDARPDYSLAMTNLARYLFMLQQSVEAEAWLQTALAMDPSPTTRARVDAIRNPTHRRALDRPPAK